MLGEEWDGEELPQLVFRCHVNGDIEVVSILPQAANSAVAAAAKLLHRCCHVTDAQELARKLPCMHPTSAK